MRRHTGPTARQTTAASAAIRGSVALRNLVGGTALVLAVSVAGDSQADEDGVSFWLPGTYGSLAAVPGQPGWSIAGILYHTSVSAGRDEAISHGGNVRLGLDSDATLLLLIPNYTLKRPVLGGQAAFSLMGIFGSNSTSVDATLTGPGSNQISGSESDSLTSYGDLYPQVSLKWNSGVNNAIVYLTGDIPIGSYDPDRLSNIGLGHAAIDAGYGYTYFDTKTGHEFSAVLGLTYNFENPDTDYKSGIDAHLDYGISRFLSQNLQVGAVGYLYQQVTGDSGSGNRVGSFESRVAGIGPQLGYLFPAGKMQGYLNLKGYYEFDAQNRPDGWNVWLTLSFSPPTPPG
jgi:hypothetical protein